MRKTAKFKLDDREIEVRELTVRQIVGLMEQHDQAADASPLAMLERFAPLATNMDIEQLLDLAPSELTMLWEAFREVNASFLGMAQKMGLADTIKREMDKLCSAAFAASSDPATDLGSGSMAGVSS